MRQICYTLCDQRGFRLGFSIPVLLGRFAIPMVAEQTKKLYQSSAVFVRDAVRIAGTVSLLRAHKAWCNWRIPPYGLYGPIPQEHST